MGLSHRDQKKIITLILMKSLQSAVMVPIHKFQNVNFCRLNSNQMTELEQLENFHKAAIRSFLHMIMDVINTSVRMSLLRSLSGSLILLV